MRLRIFMRTVLLFVLLFSRAPLGTSCYAQLTPPKGINPELLSARWSARWITVANSSPFDYGVYHFRTSFELQTKPDSFVIHVSGDNRYQLFVNGERVVWGPAREDLSHWRFETGNIASQLKTGKNVLAAVVWNFGQYAPESQVTDRSAFLLQGDGKSERLVDTVDWRGKSRALQGGLNRLSF
jgi:alpha-L-rhamnosidase